jgi:hypothetical protein
VRENETALEISTGDAASARAKLDADFRPLGFTENGESKGEVVFAGYGLVVPGEAGARYDSYAGLDVKDKIVLVFRYVPEGVDAARRAQLNRYSGLRYKAMLARERGAKGMLVVTDPNRKTKRRGRIQPDVAGRSLSAHRRDQLLHQECAGPEFLHRRA